MGTVASGSTAFGTGTTAPTGTTTAVGLQSIRGSAALGVGSRSPASAGGASPGQAGFHTAPVNGEDLVAAGGVIVAKSASVSRGPASDVQAAYGPSVFAMGTQAIQARCQAGKLNCH